MALTGFVLTAAAGNYAELRTFLDLTKEKLLIRLSRLCQKKTIAIVCYHLLSFATIILHGARKFKGTWPAADNLLKVANFTHLIRKVTTLKFTCRKLQY